MNEPDPIGGDVAEITTEHLDQLEQIICEGLQSFMAVGLALIEIRESRGYLIRGFYTFEEYCQEKFGFTARHGRRMMQAATTADEIVRQTGQRVKSESVARTLYRVVRNPGAVRHVQARLESRGQSFGSATAAVVDGIVREVMDLPPVSTMVDIYRKGICPECQTVPRTYRFSSGIWQCGHCGEEVSLHVLPTNQ